MDNYLIVSFDLSEGSKEYSGIEKDLKNLGFKNNLDNQKIPHNIFICDVNHGVRRLVSA
jgi:hypothetical protein